MKKTRYHQYSFKVRQARNVATAVVEEINKSSHLFGRIRYRPEELSYSETEETVTFRYVGGDVVKVTLRDIGRLQGGEPENFHTTQEWVVMGVTVRFYPVGGATEKVDGAWFPEQIRDLKERRPWHHPLVVSPEQEEEWNIK